MRPIRPAVPGDVVTLTELERATCEERHGWRPDGRRQPSGFPPYPTEVGYALFDAIGTHQ